MTHYCNKTGIQPNFFTVIARNGMENIVQKTTIDSNFIIESNDLLTFTWIQKREQIPIMTFTQIRNKFNQNSFYNYKIIAQTSLEKFEIPFEIFEISQ